jgi:L-alanine-DL-glutamate epimerase-like enolase superfamily enzyme
MQARMATTTTSRLLTVERAAIRFAAPFRISGYVFDAMPSVIATIAEAGITGRGEAAGVYYLGDDQDRMMMTLERVRSDVESGIDRVELAGLLPPGGARNALDCALWELESKDAGVPVWSLAGVPKPEPKVTAFTLPADDPVVLAKRIPTLDFARAIKLKLDGNVDIDRERLAVVRAARPDVWLAVDANQGFAEHDLEALARMVADFSVALVEQPVRRGDEAVLAGWHPGAPVAADESILDLTELNERAELFDVINIKLDKCGGLTEALAMAHAARVLGREVMVGNMGGSTLAMAPGFVLAQLCDYVDLDGPFGLAEDPLSEQIYENGRIFVPEELWGGASLKVQV